MRAIAKTLMLFLLISAPRFSSAQESSFQSFPITDSTSRGAIRGTLIVPDGGIPVPVVLIISGSGPTDRDGNSAKGFTNNSLKMLAENLASEKIASVRYDKRGIGKSASALIKESDLRFGDYIEDVEDWITLLRMDKRFNAIIVAGHSEGSLLGMVAANEKKADGFISIAGAGRPIDVVINEQAGKNMNNPDSVKKRISDILAELKAGVAVPNVPSYLGMLFRPSVQPYLISWLKYDPAAEIHKMKCPVMIIQGTTDLQVSLTDAHALKAAAPGSIYEVVEGMNHILKDAPSERTLNVATYNQPDLPLSSALIPAISHFIKSVPVPKPTKNKGH